MAGVLTWATAVCADITVPTGGSLGLAGGSVDLGCSDVIVAGTLSLQGGNLTNVRNISIASGGSVVAGSGSITLSCNWSNSGSFTAGTGSVNFVDAPGCATTSVIGGNTTFATLSIISATGKLYQFAPGSTQSITAQFTLTGTQALPIRVQSSVAGQPAFINLMGNQTLSQLAVTDMVATGRWLAPYQTNRNTSGSVVGWFGEPNPVPTLANGLLIALSALLLFVGIRMRRRGDRHTNNHNANV